MKGVGMREAWYRDMQTGFRKVEVMGREPNGKVKIRERGGRERTCEIGDLCAVTNESEWYVSQAAKYAALRKAWELADLDLSRRMPPYTFDE